MLPLLRVLAAVAMMSVLYNVLGQSMPYWHVRSVRMRGPGEKINWITRMGLWGYEVRMYMVRRETCITSVHRHRTTASITALESLRRRDPSCNVQHHRVDSFEVFVLPFRENFTHRPWSNHTTRTCRATATI